MRILIAGAHSHAGKTTIVAGLAAALRQRGLAVQTFKVGPDYIDPTYHTLASGRPCLNLDSWMIPPEKMVDLYSHYEQSADISIIEGVMGLFDGANYLDDAGSTAQVAKLTRSPVILVIDSGAMARSAAAVALGYQKFDPDLNLAGYLLNYVAGPAHGQGVASAVEQATGLPVLGWLSRSAELDIPERHLGLVPTAEDGRWQEFIDAAARQVAREVDIDRLLEIARGAPPSPGPAGFPGLAAQMPAGGARPIPRIAIARDEAFSFTYQENLDLLRGAGAEIVFFSPLHDPALPPGTSGVILSGGFPEMYAAQIAANHSMRQSLHSARERGLPIYAECGGLMVLTQSITDLDGREHAMFGLLPGRSLMTDRLCMGYRQAEAAGDSWLFRRGETVRGHEFHYSIWERFTEDENPAYRLLPPDGSGGSILEGASLGSVWASYLHLSFWTKPELATRFVRRCQEFSETLLFTL